MKRNWKRFSSQNFLQPILPLKAKTNSSTIIPIVNQTIELGVGKKIQTKSGRKSKEKNWGWEYLVDGGADELATEDNVTEQDAEIAAGLRVLGLFVEHETSYRHQVRLESVRRVIHLLLYSLLISFFLYVPKVARFEERWIRMAGLARDKNLGKRRRWAYLVSREVSRDTSRAWREGVSEWWSRMGADNAFCLLPRSDLAVIRSLSPSLSVYELFS